MALVQKKFLDQIGLEKVLKKFQDYPDNEILGVVINAIQDALDEKASTDLATQSTPGLMSADDKFLLDNFNPNIEKTIQDQTYNLLCITDAKKDNLINGFFMVNPLISEQIRTENLLNVDETFGEAYLSSSGSINNSSSDVLGGFIPVNPGDDIYYTGIVGQTTASSVNRRLHVYTANKTWIKQISFAGSLKVGNHWSTHGIVPSNGAYIRVSWGNTDTDVMISVGAPSKYIPYYLTPFTPITSATINISSDNTPETTESYTIQVPAAAGDLYSFHFNPIIGKLWSSTGHIASYNNEILPGEWWSDRDVYEEGTTPTIGAEVVYRLAQEDIVEYTLSSQLTIPLNYHYNYISVVNGLVINITYYAETLAVNHLTINGNVFRIGQTDVTEENIASWNHAGNLIDTKADLVGAQLTGNVTAPTLGLTNNSDRIATTAFVQQQMHNLAPYENNIRSTRDYSIGDYLTYGGYLYKVTAAIAKNTNLVVGTNIEATDVATELNLLRSLIQQ